jgi:hypothetical protein
MFGSKRSSSLQQRPKVTQPKLFGRGRQERSVEEWNAANAKPKYVNHEIPRRYSCYLRQVEEQREARLAQQAQNEEPAEEAVADAFLAPVRGLANTFVTEQPASPVERKADNTAPGIRFKKRTVDIFAGEFSDEESADASKTKEVSMAEDVKSSKAERKPSSRSSHSGNKHSKSFVEQEDSPWD